MANLSEGSREGTPGKVVFVVGQDGACRQEPDLGLYRRFLKRLIDVVAVLLAAPIVLPAIALLALIIRRDGGPAFYVQDRVGRSGRLFRCWKLRSMVPDADGLLEAYLARHPGARKEWSVHQKLRDDPRITPIGRLIRKTSLDELPQLWNVLRGEMSLVGPRPMMPEQSRLYPGNAYYRLRPGITGFWQISERNGAAFADRALYDSQYDNRLSLLTDALVLLATIRVVLRGTGH
jgi:lipopolysaccharide/colanic/teichoic acid biosynthesis glycosyltransferase